MWNENTTLQNANERLNVMAFQTQIKLQPQYQKRSLLDICPACTPNISHRKCKYRKTSNIRRTLVGNKIVDKQRVLMHGHQGWNVRHGLCHIYMRYIYIYIWVVYSLCFFCCLFITVTWWYVWCFEWASGNQEEVQACLVTLWLFIISCYSLYKTTLGLLCSWFENNPHFHKYSMDFHV